MKYIILFTLALLTNIQANAQQQRLKKGQEFIFQQSSLEYGIKETESLKRIKIRYKVLRVLKDGYDMEAQFELIDDYQRKKDPKNGNWKNVRLIYPEIDKEHYTYSLQNTLFQQEKILFFLPLKDSTESRLRKIVPSNIKLIGRKVGLDILMDQVMKDKFRNTFFNPIFNLPNNTKVNDTISLPRYKNYKVIEKNEDFTLLEIDRNYLTSTDKKIISNYKELKSKIDSANKTSNIETIQKVLRYAYKNRKFKNVEIFTKKHIRDLLRIDSKTGIILEKIETRKSKDLKSNNRMILLSKPWIKITGKIKHAKQGDSISFSYQEEITDIANKSIVKAIVNKDNTFELNLKFDDLKQVHILGKETYKFYLQPGDDIFFEMDSIDGRVINVSGIGSEKIRYALTKEHTLKEIDISQLPSQENLLSHVDKLKEINNFLSNENSFILEQFANISPELFLAEYWKNQLQGNMVNNSIDKYNHRICLQKKSKFKWPNIKNEIIKDSCFEKIHLNNELMRFYKGNEKSFLYKSYFQIGDSLKATIGLSRSTSKVKLDQILSNHYNTVENFYEGYTAFDLKLKLVYDALNSCSRDAYNNLFNRFKAQYKNHKSINSLSEIYKNVEKIQTGVKAPQFDLKDLTGNYVSLKSFNGKAVFVDFFVNRNDYHKKYIEEEQSRNKEFLDNENIQFIIIYIEQGSSKDSLWFQNLKFEGIKLVATENQAKELANTYSSLGLSHQAIIDVNGRIVTRVPPILPRAYTRPNLLYRALISQPPLQNNEKTIRILKTIIYIVIILLFICFIVWNMYRRRTKKKIQETTLQSKVRELELTAIRAQMNPHFMYNCLNSIQNLVQKKQNDEAHLYLSKFAKLIRSVLNNSDKEEISLATELEMISNYVELEQLRFDIKFIVDTNNKIDPYSVFIPPLILQPLVENAILHGLAPKQGERKLSIDIKYNEPGIICVSIVDNGVGRNQNEEKLTTSNGKGIKFSQERLNLLAQKYGTEYKMEIDDLKDKQGLALGTKVQICFPEE